ncbi:MAG: hypothetical protein ACTSRP_01765 [Candidatus Helarchaeota archaeon]
MKSWNENLSFIKDYFLIIINPSKISDKINKEPVNLLKSLLITLISSIILIAGVFIAGGTLYNIFFEQYSSYFLEIITSGQLFNYYLTHDQYILVFFSEVIFLIKMWAFTSFIIYILLKLLKENVRLSKILNMITWSISPFAWIFFIVSLISLLFKFIIPLFFHFIFYGSILIVFVLIIPYYLLNLSKNLSLKSNYNLYLSYYLTLVILFLIYTLNHYNVFLFQIL